MKRVVSQIEEGQERSYLWVDKNAGLGCGPVGADLLELTVLQGLLCPRHTHFGEGLVADMPRPPPLSSLALSSATQWAP